MVNLLDLPAAVPTQLVWDLTVSLLDLLELMEDLYHSRLEVT